MAAPATTPQAPARQPRPVVYPTSDGKPMAETDKHADLMVYFKEALKAFVRLTGRLAYVSGNNFLFWQEGDPRKKVSPDCYVVPGVSPDPRDSYMAWRENGRLPSVVFEFTSRKTQKEDMHTKRPLYEQVLRVPEYFQFDPTGDYLRPRLQGLRLDANGVYQPIAWENGRMHSQQLGLDLVTEGETVRLFDPARQELLLTPQEQAERVQVEAARAQAEAERADAAEVELARLRARLAALESLENNDNPQR